MTVLCVNSTVVYADIAAADAAEGGTNYGVPTRFEQTGTSSSSVFFVDVDYPSSLIYIATAGEETTGDIAVGAQMTATITTSVDNGVFQSLRTSMLNTSSAVDHHNQDIIASGSGLDVFTYGSNAGTDDNCIAHDCSEGWRGGSTNNNHISTNCTAIDCSGFGFLRPRAVDTVALNTTSATYLQEGASSSNYWADDGNGSDAITEGTPTDIFEDYAGGDYRIKASSSPGVAGAGAFISAGGGGISITGTTVNYSLSEITGSIDLTGSIDITGQSPNYNYSPIAGDIDLTGEILVSGTTVNYPYSALGGAIDLTGAINIIGATASYNYQSINGVVDLTGIISVTGQTPDYVYLSLNGSVELGALISVIGQSPNYNYANIPGDITLTGEISITGVTPTYSYSAVNGFVVIGEGQAIGTVTAGFAADIYSASFEDDKFSVKYKLSGITVNFKE